jgi:integrase
VDGGGGHLRCMTSLLLPVVTGESSSAERLHVVVAAYLARYRGLSRQHTASDLRVFLVWCDERGLDPLAARRAHLERYVRWCQEVRRFRPSTVSRRTWVVCGFYRTCVIDGLLEHSPAQWLRRPTVPPESPHPRTDAPAVRGAADRGPRVDQTATTSPWSRCSPARAAHLRGLRRRRQRPGRRARPPGAAGGRQGHQGRPGPVATRGRAGDRPRCRRAHPPAAAEPARRTNGPSCRHPPAAPPRRRRGRATTADAPAHAPPHLRHHHARRRSTPASTGAMCISPPATQTPVPPCATTGHARTSTDTPTTPPPPTWPPAPD